MNELLAALFLMVSATAIMLGNFWFTYGIWPRSWWSFVVFSMLSLILQRVLAEFMKGEKR
jgi:membrane protein implicated in regulation of membrane protease activity